MVSLLPFFFLLLYLFIYSSLYTCIYIYIYIYFNCISLLFQAEQATFRAKEMVNYSHRKMKEEEEGRRITAMDAFHVAKKSIQKLKAKLTEEERERKSTAAALDSVERQAEG